MFPGIDSLIEKAQHIAVITIVQHISGDGQGYDEYHVLVIRTLKGTIPEDKTVAMSLLVSYYVSTSVPMDAWFIEHRTYIVFLEDTKPPLFKAPYRNLQMFGSCWEASLPHPDWRPDPKAPIRDTIKMLVNENLQMKEQILAGERTTFNEVFEKINTEQIDAHRQRYRNEHQN